MSVDEAIEGIDSEEEKTENNSEIVDEETLERAVDYQVFTSNESQQQETLPTYMSQ